MGGWTHRRETGGLAGYRSRFLPINLTMRFDAVQLPGRIEIARLLDKNPRPKNPHQNQDFQIGFHRSPTACLPYPVIPVGLLCVSEHLPHLDCQISH